mgnify:CR=1 FL=1
MRSVDQRLGPPGARPVKPGACRSLGLLYRDGAGLPRDYARAATLFRKACDGGFGAGCVDLGVAHMMGRGVARDVARVADFDEIGQGHVAGEADDAVVRGMHLQ